MSLPEEDVDFLDGYAEEAGLGSRSAALQRAVSLLRALQLGPAYESAWDEWAAGGDQDAWETASADGLS